MHVVVTLLFYTVIKIPFSQFSEQKNRDSFVVNIQSLFIGESVQRFQYSHHWHGHFQFTHINALQSLFKSFLIYVPNRLNDRLPVPHRVRRMAGF